MNREDKRRNRITILGILGVLALLIGTSLATFSTNLLGTKEQSINIGCLKVEMGDTGNLSLDNEVPITDEDGLDKTPYTYTLTNTCTVDAFYTATLNVINTSTIANLSKVKVALGGDSYLKPTLISNLEETELVDSSETNIAKTYILDEGYLVPNEVKTFNLRNWIDYDVEEISGSVSSKVIVKSEAKKGSVIIYDTNTSGYTVLKGKSIINNAAYNLTAPSGNQVSGIIKVEDKYYFRGNPTDNYVTFAGKTWRVVSTNSDGSINIVLDTSTTNSTYSNITSSLNSFYSSISSEEQYIKTNSTFCEEKTSNSVYVAKTRLEGNKPSTTCDSNNTMTKIGLLSVDDLMYAGAVYNQTNNSFYLKGNASYWTNSWSTSSTVYNYTTSTFAATSTGVSLALKPVITLNSNVLLEGKGTSSEPFYVSGTYDNADDNYDYHDTEAPTIIYARVDDKWANHNKYIEISASDKDGQSGVAGYYISTSSTKPTASAGGWEATSSIQYTSVNAYDNGTYYAFVKDSAGNVSNGKQVTIEKVDKVNPTCTINIEPDGTVSEYKTLTVIGNDTSGIDPNGYSWTLSDSKNDVAKVDMNGTYTATVTDMAGNKGTCNATIDSISDGTYKIDVIVTNGTVDTPSKRITANDETSFNLTPNNPSHTPSYICTNKAKATLTNNLLTVSNPTSNTTCTVRYDTYQTVLYTDGTLIINEGTSDRTSNIATHGAVTNTYNPWSNSESYMTSAGYWDLLVEPLWYNEADNITRVEIGSPVKPISTSGWFMYEYDLKYGDFTLLDTSNTIDMSWMFCEAGGSSDLLNDEIHLIGLNEWDTSSVEDMSGMFADAGYFASTWDIGDLSNWNVSNVVSMTEMFWAAGSRSLTLTIGDLSDWDVSSAIDMSRMFTGVGASATTWSIGNLSNWDVSNATDMSGMFQETGFNSATWDIGDLSNWDVSNVTDMSWMFKSAGLDATTLTISFLSNWDTSNVTDMSYMFSRTGYNSETVELNLSGWDVSNVTDMAEMFLDAGHDATTWSVIIPRKTGSLDNTTSIFYGKTSSVYAVPADGRLFTLASS